MAPNASPFIVAQKDGDALARGLRGHRAQLFAEGNVGVIVWSILNHIHKLQRIA